MLHIKHLMDPSTNPFTLFRSLADLRDFSDALFNDRNKLLRVTGQNLRPLWIPEHLRLSLDSVYTTTTMSCDVDDHGR